jgi:restriction endonuclease S subunit
MSGTGITMHPSVKNLESVVKRVRDVLRKGDGITDMDSMAHCVLFTAARMLDTHTAAKLNVPYTWDTVISKVLAKDINGADKAFKDILEVLDSKFSTNEFTWKLKVQDDFEKIVKLFNELDIHEVAKHTDVLGFIYEQHISTGSGGGRDLGKFYTDRQITRYLTELLGSDVTAGRPDSMCDATMGTGGFILSYIEYVTKICPEVRWDDYDLAGGDIDDKVAAIARLNVFLRTGKLFPMIRKRNTLKNDIGDSSDKRKTFKRLLMNIPFGVKGLTLADDCCERIKEIVKVGTKSEPLFMTLTCQLLAEGGKAAVIVPDGVLESGSKQHDTFRKYLLDNFKVLRIIKMRGKFFMNTTIQPSVIVFERSGKTDIVEFWDVEKIASGELIETCMLKVPREKFDGSCSFDMRRYRETNAVANPAGFPIVKLSDICDDISTNKNIPSSERIDGEFRFFTCSRDYSTHNKSHYEGTYLIHGSRGSTISESVFATYNEKFAIGTSMFVSEVKDKNRVYTKYVYYYLKFNKNMIDNLVNSTAIPMISKTSYYTIDILLPPLTIQQEIVESLDLIYNNAATAKASATSIKAQMAAVMRSVGARGFEKKKLDTICKVSFGERITKKDNTGSIYPVYGSGFDTFRTDKFNREGMTCKLGRFAISEVNMAILVNGPYWLMDSGFTVDSKDESVMIKEFLWHLLLTDKNRLSHCSTGSCQKNIEMDRFYMLEYPCPPLPIQQEVLAILNEMEAELKTMEQMAAKAEQRAKYILDGYLSTQTTVEPERVQEIAVESQATNEVVPMSQEAPKPKKKVFKVKKSD